MSHKRPIRARSQKGGAIFIKELNEVDERCLVEIERALQGLDQKPAGAWDIVQVLKLLDS
jgi:hypothetical protein